MLIGNINTVTIHIQSVNADFSHMKKVYGLLVASLLAASFFHPGWPVASDATAWAYERENAVVKSVKQVGPAVVNISTEYEVSYRTNPFAQFGADNFFEDFFDRRLERKRKLNSLGSGVIIDGQRGFILTNSHVIVKSGKVTAVLNDGREFTAEIVGADPESDLAVLQIKADAPLPAVKMGDSDDLLTGETVIAIGNPFGFSHTVTTGVISAINRSFKADDRVYHDFIQTDASINPGNSGGPLLNINGELIGINTAIYKNAEGIGFAIPINKARKIVSDLIAYGKVMPAWIGLRLQNVDPQLARYLNLPSAQGLAVQSVYSDSPADRAGIREGDIILSIGDRGMQTKTDYRDAMRVFADGQNLNLRVLREGKTRTVAVQASRFPDSLAPMLARQLLGVDIVAISKKNRYKPPIAADAGVIITEIDPQSALGGIGVRPGDVIRKINEIATNDPDAFYKAIVKYQWKDSLVVLLQRGTRGYYITVKL